MTLRTYPIRVGNTADGESGPGYSDQRELSWEQLGLKAELTSVTKRVRRVFSFSQMQVEQAYQANKPNVIFLNFCNYTRAKELDVIIGMVKEVAPNAHLLLGNGPKASNIYTHGQYRAGAMAVRV